MNVRISISLKTTLLVMVLALLNACGGSSNNVTNDQGPQNIAGGANTGTQPADPEPEPVIDTQAPALLSITPADGSIRNSINTTIEAIFSEELDNDVVNKVTVSLINGSGNSIPFSINYDNATRTVTITPARQLEYGELLTLTVSDIADTAGNTMSPFELSFSTYINPVSKTVRYNERNITGYDQYLYDSNGNEVNKITYNGANDNGLWFDGDDIIVEYTTKSYDANNNLFKEVSYNSPGGDNSWMASDDNTIKTYLTYTYDNNKRIDTISYSANLEISSYSRNYYGDRGQITHDALFFGPGSNGTWREAENNDDSLLLTTFYFYDDNNNLTHRVPYMFGSFSASQYQIDSYDSSNKKFKSTTYNDPGPDGKWLTADDLIASYKIYSYDDNGNLTRIIKYNTDDEILGYDGINYNMDGSISEALQYSGPGLDNTWLTADDEISNYNTTSYSENGNRINSVNYVGAGADDDWFTIDDNLISSSIEYDPDI